MSEQKFVTNTKILLPDDLPDDPVGDPVAVVAAQQLRTGKENACYAGKRETEGGGVGGRLR